MGSQPRPEGPVPPALEALAARVVDAAFAVHEAMGPGLEEAIYLRLLAYEVAKRGSTVEERVPLPVVYDGRTFDVELEVDLLVDGALLVEVETADRLDPAHTSRMLTLLRSAGGRLGLVLNFHAPRMQRGVRRVEA